MKLNLDELVDQIAPWEFEVTVRGSVYRARALTLGDMAAMIELEKRGGVAAGATAAEAIDAASKIVEAARRFLISVAVGECPGVHGWDAEQVMMVLTALGACFREHTKKKRQAVARAVETIAGETGSTIPGS